jgi:hypothetical protein
MARSLSRSSQGIREPSRFYTQILKSELGTYTAASKRRSLARFQSALASRIACHRSTLFLAAVCFLMFFESLKCRLACLPGSASGAFPLGASHVWNSATRLLNLERGFMVLTREAITFFARQHALWTLRGMNSYVRSARTMMQRS